MDSAEGSVVTEDDVRSIRRPAGDEPGPRPALPGLQEATLEKHRNMMLASLLEDYYRTRALEFLNDANPSQKLSRNSQEVQALARRLFDQAGGVLSSNGWLPPAATSDESKAIRDQYLSGLDNLAGLQTQDIVDSMRNLALPSPAAGLSLTVRAPPDHQRSHYTSSFREECLLGKGGFGKVYKCYNFLDRKTYAVKKIALPQKLVQSLSDKKHDDLQHILREVQAMALLEHPNIVRYHATWFEEPQATFTPLPTLNDAANEAQRPQQQQLLLDSRAFGASNAGPRSISLSGGVVFEDDTGEDRESAEYSDEEALSGVVFGEDSGPSPDETDNDDDEMESSGHGIVFGEDTEEVRNSAENKGQEVQHARGRSEDDDKSALDSGDPSSDLESSQGSIFTDGRTRSEGPRHGPNTPEASAPPALYIQMSMYPMTLSQFLSPRPGRPTGLRHCFHLVPSLRLLLPIHDGLQYIHSKGYIHRDIKPGNIFLSAPEAAVVLDKGSCNLACKVCANVDVGETRSPPVLLNPRIGDFGLVHQLAQGEMPESSSTSQSHMQKTKRPSSDKVVGTTYYQPPQQKAGGERKDEKIDIFALGVVFSEMLCRCDTAMERAMMLQGLQDGQLPVGLEKTMKEEGHDSVTITSVLNLLASMIEADADKRWDGMRVRSAIEELLSRCQE